MQYDINHIESWAKESHQDDVKNVNQSTVDWTLPLATDQWPILESKIQSDLPNIKITCWTALQHFQTKDTELTKSLKKFFLMEKYSNVLKLQFN